MTARYVEFKSEHLQKLLEEDAVSYLRPYFSENVTKTMEQAAHITSIEMNGKVVLCGGVSMYWPGRGEAWVFFDSSCKTNFVPVFRLVKKWLDEVPVRRIEAAVDVGSMFAHRHVQLLGFKMEAPFMKSFRPDGGDCSLYSKVKVN
jgi:hypothetical protein